MLPAGCRIEEECPIVHAIFEPLDRWRSPIRKEENPNLSWNPGGIRLNIILLRPVRFYPLRVWFESPPLVPHEQLLGDPQLPRPRKLRGDIPRRVAPGTPMRRWTKRFVRGVDLPYSVGSISVARSAA